LETKNFLVKKKPHQPIQPKLCWFGPDFILKVNRTKPNRMFFYLAVQMTFNLKTEQNCTANTPKHMYTINTFPSLQQAIFFVLSLNKRTTQIEASAFHFY